MFHGWLSPDESGVWAAGIFLLFKAPANLKGRSANYHRVMSNHVHILVEVPAPHAAAVGSTTAKSSNSLKSLRFRV